MVDKRMPVKARAEQKPPTPNLVIPNHIQIEIVNGMCTSRCTMCSYKQWRRKPHIMDNEMFRKVLTWFVPHLAAVELVSFQGWGEPLLDKDVPEKVRIAKDLGFRGVGFATNATELDETMGRRLMEAGLDSIICGIDGLKKETHEAIRVGTNFDRIVANVKRFIWVRNETNAKTRVVIRLIRQKQNYEEWPAFRDYWNHEIDRSRGDDVFVFDIHNCAGSIDGYEQYDVNADVDLGAPCDELFLRIMILSDGMVAFCNADINGFYSLGSAADEDPIAIFNNEIFTRVRRMMGEGRIMEIEHCKDCTIPRSRALKRTE